MGAIAASTCPILATKMRHSRDHVRRSHDMCPRSRDYVRHRRHQVRYNRDHVRHSRDMCPIPATKMRDSRYQVRNNQDADHVMRRSPNQV